MGSNEQTGPAAVGEEAGKVLAVAARWEASTESKEAKPGWGPPPPQDPHPDYQWHDQISPSPATSTQDLSGNLGLEAYSGEWLFQC